MTTMAPAAPTKRSTPRLSDLSRKVVIPKGIVTTSWPRVVRLCADMGVTFDPWEDGVGAIALGKRADGKYAATVGGVVLSIPRQVGKTFLVGMIVIALCILYPGLTVLWTAHHGRTATKTFAMLNGITKRPKIARYMLPPRTANGEQELRFRNRSVIMFGARAQGFGRGFEEVDVEVFDEAQILTEKTLDDMVPAANQSKHEAGALLFFIGTPPRPTDPGEEFTNRRAKAYAGDSENMVFVEIGAEQDDDPDDRDLWPAWNPSYPLRTPAESIERMREQLTEDSFRREAMGIWDPVVLSGVIPPPVWEEQGKGHSLAVDRFALGVEVGPDLMWASVAFAGERPDGGWHIELDEDQHTMGRGTAWLIPHLEAFLATNSQIRAVVVDVGGPIKALLEQRHNYRWYFIGTTIQATPVKVVDLGAGCAKVLDGVISGWLHHIDQPQLTAAALAAGRRPLGDTGMWVWSRKMAESDITPIQASTLALIGAQNSNVNVRKPTYAGGGRRVVTQ